MRINKRHDTAFKADINQSQNNYVGDDQNLSASCHCFHHID